MSQSFEFEQYMYQGVVYQIPDFVTFSLEQTESSEEYRIEVLQLMDRLSRDPEGIRLLEGISTNLINAGAHELVVTNFSNIPSTAVLNPEGQIPGFEALRDEPYMMINYNSEVLVTTVFEPIEGGTPVPLTFENVFLHELEHASSPFLATMQEAIRGLLRSGEGRSNISQTFRNLVSGEPEKIEEAVAQIPELAALRERDPEMYNYYISELSIAVDQMDAFLASARTLREAGALEQRGESILRSFWGAGSDLSYASLVVEQLTQNITNDRLIRLYGDQPLRGDYVDTCELKEPLSTPITITQLTEGVLGMLTPPNSLECERQGNIISSFAGIGQYR